MNGVIVALLALVCAGVVSGDDYTTASDRDWSTTQYNALSTNVDSPTIIKFCLESKNCWLKYPFIYDKSWTACLGDQYVTKYREYYVGVVLCNSTTYKIYMSDEINWEFKHIAFSRMKGENHCEFVGATTAVNVLVDSNTTNSTTTYGYFRNFWRWAVQNGTIGASPQDTGRYYGHWYKCGFDIPGNRYVVDFNDVKIPRGMTISTVNPAPSNAKAVFSCLERSNCWLKYSFKYDDNWNGCHGDQYVTKYKQYFVGAILCSITKYKLFMSESLNDTFLNIADSSGLGRDHCQFVGAKSERQAHVSTDYMNSPTSTGYWRELWGGTVKKGQIGISPKWTGKYYMQWYKCGVNIPSDDVVIYNRETLIPSTAIPSTTVANNVESVYSCLGRSSCWLKYPFKYENNWNSCHGDQYVRMYKQYYVGAILCSRKRYKLFMSESLYDTFLNIADNSGNGRDHCQFVGATSENNVTLPDDFWDSPSTTGYWRSFWNGKINKGRIGGGTGSGSWTGNYYVKWYECGVNIPSDDVVVYNMDPSLSALPTTRPTMERTLTYTECLRSDNCWFKFTFIIHEPNQYCLGEQYVTKYNQYYVGVRLCSSFRYKIFMSDRLFGTFLNIGDSNGDGRDHCEFIRATSTQYGKFKVDMNNKNSSNTQGFYRKNWGDSLIMGLIGTYPRWTGNYYGQWYECGISIPGSNKIVDYMDTPLRGWTPQTSMTTTSSNIQYPVPCNPVRWPSNAQATAKGSYPYSTYGCNVCTDREYEVHVIKMYQSAASATNLRIKALKSDIVRIKLVLMTYQTTNWLITSPKNVRILEVRLASHYGDQPSVSIVTDDKTKTIISKDKKTYFSSFTDIKLLTQYVIENFGFMSSYSGVRLASDWILHVGSCDVTHSEIFNGSMSSSSHESSIHLATVPRIGLIIGIVFGAGSFICVTAGTVTVIIVCLLQQKPNTLRTITQGNPSTLRNQGGALPYQRMSHGQNPTIQPTGQVVNVNNMNQHPHNIVQETDLSNNEPKELSFEQPQYNEITHISTAENDNNKMTDMDSAEEHPIVPAIINGQQDIVEEPVSYSNICVEVTDSSQA